MFVGAPPAPAKVTLCVCPLVLFHVTVPPVWIVRDVGEKLLAPMVTVLVDGAGPGAGPGPVGPSPPPPPPPPPQDSNAKTSMAPIDRERMDGIKVLSGVWFCPYGLPEQNTTSGVAGSCRAAPGVGRA